MMASSRRREALAAGGAMCRSIGACKWVELCCLSGGRWVRVVSAGERVDAGAWLGQKGPRGDRAKRGGAGRAEEGEGGAAHHHHPRNSNVGPATAARGNVQREEAVRALRALHPLLLAVQSSTPDQANPHARPSQSTGASMAGGRRRPRPRARLGLGLGLLVCWVGLLGLPVAAAGATGATAATAAATRLGQQDKKAGAGALALPRFGSSFKASPSSSDPAAESDDDDDGKGKWDLRGFHAFVQARTGSRWMGQWMDEWAGGWTQNLLSSVQSGTSPTN